MAELGLSKNAAPTAAQHLIKKTVLLFDSEGVAVSRPPPPAVSRQFFKIYADFD